MTDEDHSGPNRSEGELQDVVGEQFVRLNEGNVSEFQRQKAGGALPTELPIIDENDDVHRIMMEVEPSLRVSDLMEHTDDPWGVSLSLPGADVMVPQTRESLVWDVEELYSTGLPDQNQQVSIVVVSAMLAVRCVKANAAQVSRRRPCRHLSN